MSMVNRLLGSVAAVLPYLFLYLAAFVDPGYITPENHFYHMEQYPYDFSAFHPGKFCHTCRLLKPPRSKHCSVCKKCVAKMDHHCIFINKCVGQRNHRYFVLLLLSTAVLASYGGILGFSILKDKILIRYPLWSPWKPAGMTWRDYMLIWSWGLEHNTRIGAVSLLAILCSPMVWAFLFYTVFLIYCGTTTNESLKWSDWRLEMKEGFVFKRAMSLTREKYLSVEPAITRWPVETEQIIVRTADGSLPDPQCPGAGEWERVHSLRDIDNIYDLGFADNLRDIFFDNYQFRERDRQRELWDAKNGLPPFDSTSHRRKRRAKAAAI
ncbi:palmitoyltransferase swf1 [Ceratocystis pirilliformis]|uniref:Palmitoyltransferase n=1 Tax=Ceratocystis pirilliformis TaxID=259994 RepID=A0ABR3YJH8_9PEZI